jgi:FtsH-binding integral membrane protein
MLTLSCWFLIWLCICTYCVSIVAVRNIYLFPAFYNYVCIYYFFHTCYRSSWKMQTVKSLSLHIVTLLMEPKRLLIDNITQPIDKLCNQLHTESQLIIMAESMSSWSKVTGYSRWTLPQRPLGPFRSGHGCHYRGTSLVSCLCKLFTSLISMRITRFCDSFELLGYEQAGFPKNFSTCDHMFYLITMYTKITKKKL